MPFWRLKLVKHFAYEYAVKKKSSAFELLDAALGNKDSWQIKWQNVNDNGSYSLQWDNKSVSITNSRNETIYSGTRDNETTSGSDMLVDYNHIRDNAKLIYKLSSFAGGTIGLLNDGTVMVIVSGSGRIAMGGSVFQLID